MPSYVGMKKPSGNIWWVGNCWLVSSVPRAFPDLFPPNTYHAYPTSDDRVGERKVDKKTFYPFADIKLFSVVCNTFFVQACVNSLIYIH